MMLRVSQFKLMTMCCKSKMSTIVSVRPKQVPQEGETPSQALANRGIGYVELRCGRC